MHITGEDSELLNTVIEKLTEQEAQFLTSLFSQVEQVSRREGYNEGFRKGTANGVRSFRERDMGIDVSDIVLHDASPLDTPLESLLADDHRLLNALRRSGFHMLGELVNTPPEYFRDELAGFGRVSADKLDVLFERTGYPRRQRIWYR